MNILSAIKSSILWRYFILFFIKPIYEIIWEYLINVEGKILYFLWFKKKKKNYFNLINQDKLLVLDNKDFGLIANEIRSNCNHRTLELSRDFIKKKQTNKNLTNSGENTYKNNINYLLDESIKKKIFKFACSKEIISTAANYLKVFPVLNRLEVYHNLPVKPDQKRGAMMWHRDDFGYKSLDLFITVTELNDKNGPLTVTREVEKLGVFGKIRNVIKNPVSGERGKVSDDNFSDYLKKKGEIILKGLPGTGLFIDSFTAYHKGGHCIEGERLMLRISFTTPDAINLDDNFKERENYYNFQIEESLEPKFNEFLLKKKSYFLSKLVSKRNLLNLYRILHFKLN